MNYKRYAALLFAMLMLSSCVEPESDTKDPKNSTPDNNSSPVQEGKTSQTQPKKPAQKPQKQDAQKKINKSGVIGWCETNLLDAGRPRITNIKLAMRKINGKVLKPGEEFSFNNTVGRRTSSRGFKNATIFRNKKEVKEVGGGICQLSSTLYCAAKAADLKITERHEHQLPVDYVKKGDDATIYYGSLDFKFINNTDVPIAIHCKIENRKVQVGISAITSK